MSKVLYIKANSKPDGVSRTFKISDAFVEQYKKHHPEDDVVVLDLYKLGIHFLEGEDLEYHNPAPGVGKDHPVLKYAYQFLEADKYVIAEPLWNLSIPAILKAYIDYICVSGITFHYTAEGPVGLCNGKKAINITTRGGNYSSAIAKEYELGDKYLRTILGFMGVLDFSTIAAEQLDVVGVDVEEIVAKEIEEAKKIAETF